jgi:hypothetical protein
VNPQKYFNKGLSFFVLDIAPYEIRKLEEHISREENDDKSHIISQSNVNNIEKADQSIEENVLPLKKEQIEYSKPSADQDLGESGPEYIYGNEDDEEHQEVKNQ